MMTAKEIFLELLKPDGQPDRLLRQYEALHMCLGDPINTYLRGNRKRGTVSVDRWGTTISFPEDAPGPMPVTHDGLAVCPDVTRWRETVHAPDLAANCTEGWEAVRQQAREACGQEKLLAGFMGTGIFEQCHFLMGFEDTLTALYEHPQEMHELIEYITEYRLGYVKLLIDNLQPDVIFSHDDWGTKNALFMQPEMWREFLKEPYRRFYGYIRSRGCIAVHHADSYLAPIVEDMAELGIQVWQGVLPENDIPALQRQLRGRLVLMGGMGAAIDRADASPEEIRDYAKNVLASCGPLGHFIPSITYGLAGTVYPHVDRYIDEAIDGYNRQVHLPKFDLPPVPRRVLAQKESGDAVRTAESGDNALDRVAAAFGETCYEVPVGFKHISAGMREHNAVIGGESSGGLTVRGHINGKDGIYAATLLVEMLSVTGKKMSALMREIYDEFGTAYMTERDWPFDEETKQRLNTLLMVDKKLPDFPVPVKSVNYMDGCKVLFDNGWLIARFSGTEPRIRIFCEMPTREEAERLTGVMAAFLHLPTP